MNRAFFTVVCLSARVSITNHPARVQPITVVASPAPVESYDHAITEVTPEGVRGENVFVDPDTNHDEFFDDIGVDDIAPDVQMNLDKEDAVSMSDGINSIDYNKTESDSIALSETFVLAMSYNEAFISEDQLLDDSGVVILTKEASGLIAGSLVNEKVLNGVIVEQELF